MRMLNENRCRVVILSSNSGFADTLRSFLNDIDGFDVVATLETPPADDRMPTFLGHFRPNCLFADCSNLAATYDLLSSLDRLHADCPVIACAPIPQPELVLDLLRGGAFDYVSAPFREEVLHEVFLRLQRRQQLQPTEETPSFGRLIGFSSAKPGSGSTTIATQTAFALRRQTGRRVLLIDLNFAGGTSSGWAGLRHRSLSVLDALASVSVLQRSTDWATWTLPCNGIHILPAPVEPETDAVPPEHILQLVEAARHNFDWVVLDLPCAANILTLGLASHLNDLVLISAAELSSLHMAQRVLPLLAIAGVDLQSLHLVLNRVQKRDALTAQVIEKVLRKRVDWTLPNDYFSLQAAGQLALTGESALALGIRELTASLAKPAGPVPAVHEEAFAFAAT
jgi:pilus assembly protein CpaE